MTYSRKAALSLFASVLFFFAVLVFPLEARADNVAITDGSVFIGGPPFSRGSWRTVSFNFAGDNFSAAGGVGDGITQQVNSPCSGPCPPGVTIFPNSAVRLDGVGVATFNGTQHSAWWFGRDSVLNFEGPGVVIPDSTEQTLVLTSSFTMTGTVIVHSLDDIPNHAVIFSTGVSGSGIATLTLHYFPNLGPGGYIFSSIRYDFTPVPEPATMILLGTGLAGLAARHRRRRSNRPAA